MKRLICVLLAGVLLLATGCGSTPSEDVSQTDVLPTGDNVLNVYNWGVYMDLGTDDGAFYDEESAMDANIAFEQWYLETYGQEIEVNYTTYENNEAMYQKIKAGGAKYDVIVPSDYMLNRLLQEGLLEKLDFSEIPNYANVSNQFKQGGGWQYDPTYEYSVPYMWGYVGIVYNADLQGDFTTWDALWREEYQGQILMFNNARDAFAIALAKNGYSLNTTDPAHWQKAYEDLEVQKSLLQGYVTDEVFDKMQNGEAMIAACYYGDYLTMAANTAEGITLKFGAITGQGSNKFVDSFCIPTCCQNKVVAQRYINFMCSYEAGLANANYTGYSSPLECVKENTPPADSPSLHYEYTGDRGVYPEDSRLAGYEEFLYLGESTQALMDNLWKELRKSGVTPEICIAMGALVVGALVLLVIRYQMKRRKAAIHAKVKQEMAKELK